MKNTVSSFLIPSLVFSLFSQLAFAHPEFPPGFRWCTATSAHQIEGGNTESDWWDWEQVPGHIKGDEKSGAAAGHWDRLAEDTLLLHNLNATDYRMGIEWAKIEPREGEYDLAALTHYALELTLLRAAGITPIVTLSHFSIPRWFLARGGWAWDGAPEAFRKFTALSYDWYGSLVRDWITLNEPMVYVAAAYVGGVFPPGHTSLDEAESVVLGMVRAHAAAYHELHRLAAHEGRPVRAGVAHHLRAFDPKHKWNPMDRWATKVVARIGNWTFPDAFATGRVKIKIPFFYSLDVEVPEAAGTQDFLGVNYYTRDLISFNLTRTPPFVQHVKKGAAVSDLGWEIYPDGLLRVLRDISARMPAGLPILITENGIADAEDSRRPQFLLDHLERVRIALDEKIPVEGYCHWSLLDNFEWAEGFGPRFGLIAVDYSTMKRTPRPSASVFAEKASP